MRFHLSAFADEASESMAEQLDALAAAGIRQIELRFVDGLNIGELTPAAARELRRRLDDAGVSISAIGSPYGKIKLTDPFAPHLDAFRRTLETAQELGATRLRLFSFFLDGKPHAACRAQVFERMDALLTAAKDSGVLCCHENEKGIYGDGIRPCLDLLSTFAGRLGGVFDPANFLQVEQDPWKAFTMLRPYITYYHIKDIDSATGELVPAGEGDGQIPRLLQTLAAEEDDLTLTLEPHLAVFGGLAALEEDGGASLKRRYTFESNRAAFDTAAAALKTCLVNAGCAEADGVWTSQK